MPQVIVTIPACAGCCAQTCREFYGDVLELVASSIVSCGCLGEVGEFVFIVFPAGWTLTWSEPNQRWEQTAGEVEIYVDDLDGNHCELLLCTSDITFYAQCVEGPGSEIHTIRVVGVVNQCGGGVSIIYENDDVTLDVAASNTLACGDPTYFGGGGQITLSLP